MGGGNSLKPSHNHGSSLIEAFNNLAPWGEKKFVSELKRTYKFQRGVYCHTEDNSPKYRMVGKIYQCLTNVDKRLRNKCAMTCFGNMSQNSFTDKVFSHFTSHFSLKRAGATHVALCDSFGSYFRHWCAAFTLAEVLITLGIIGIVVAMTMPTLIQNYKNRVVETRLQKFYSVMNQAVQKAELEYGDKKFWYEDVGGLKTDADGNPIEGSSKTDDWFQKYLAPHLQIIKKEVSSDGIPTYYFPDGSALAASQAGESRDWVFYVGKPEKCRTKHNNDPGICAFIFEFYPASQSNSWKYLYDKGFEPAKVGWNGTKENLYAGNAWACDKTGNTIDSRAYCAALIQYNGWKIPKDYPVRVDY